VLQSGLHQTAGQTEQLWIFQERDLRHGVSPLVMGKSVKTIVGKGGNYMI